ncbi:unnamed protein product [Acanthoscelides obtectus]|uniref:Uncharacterized protein n=2 Tax=Acanthoscelides obtectus TaxID=200917 RepID=A0A9P0P9X2_ACAOB|nr:unnamed protein product [Acanthoscelides obtectus]CAK1680129.1 hypothetical protein AOBTE_LOCUS32514 [Acanthoscelides obtectus]
MNSTHIFILVLLCGTIWAVEDGSNMGEARRISQEDPAPRRMLFKLLKKNETTEQPLENITAGAPQWNTTHISHEVEQPQEHAASQNMEHKAPSKSAEPVKLDKLKQETQIAPQKELPTIDSAPPIGKSPIARPVGDSKQQYQNIQFDLDPTVHPAPSEESNSSKPTESPQRERPSAKSEDLQKRGPMEKKTKTSFPQHKLQLLHSPQQQSTSKPTIHTKGVNQNRAPWKVSVYSGEKDTYPGGKDFGGRPIQLEGQSKPWVYPEGKEIFEKGPVHPEGPSNLWVYPEGKEIFGKRPIHPVSPSKLWLYPDAKAEFGEKLIKPERPSKLWVYPGGKGFGKRPVQPKGQSKLSVYPGAKTDFGKKTIAPEDSSQLWIYPDRKYFGEGPIQLVIPSKSLVDPEGALIFGRTPIYSEGPSKLWEYPDAKADFGEKATHLWVYPGGKNFGKRPIQPNGPPTIWIHPGSKTDFGEKPERSPQLWVYPDRKYFGEGPFQLEKPSKLWQYLGGKDFGQRPAQPKGVFTLWAYPEFKTGFGEKTISPVGSSQAWVDRNDFGKGPTQLEKQSKPLVDPEGKEIFGKKPIHPEGLSKLWVYPGGKIFEKRPIQPKAPPTLWVYRGSEIEGKHDFGERPIHQEGPSKPWAFPGEKQLEERPMQPEGPRPIQPEGPSMLWAYPGGKHSVERPVQIGGLSKPWAYPGGKYFGGLTQPERLSKLWIFPGGKYFGERPNQSKEPLGLWIYPGGKGYEERPDEPENPSKKGVPEDEALGILIERILNGEISSDSRSRIMRALGCYVAMPLSGGLISGVTSSEATSKPSTLSEKLKDYYKLNAAKSKSKEHRGNG